MTRQFTKRVAIKATDDDEMTATGVVLTPNELDHQLDWFGAEDVETMYADDPDDGVMHGSFPENHSSLERNEVLESSEDIGGHEFSAGDWVVTRQYSDSDRWSLVKDGVLGAFSMGGEISEVREFDSAEDLPSEVEIPDEVDPNAVDEKYHPPTQVVDGEVSEISDVDVGAVPSADHAVVKTVGKNILEETNSVDEFVALMVDRGATRSEAERLYEYMVSADKSEKTDMKNDVQSIDNETLGKRFKRFLFGDGDTDTDSDDADKSAEDTDGDSDEDATSSGSAKAGQTLSSRNQNAVMAAVDAQLDVLEDGGVEHGMVRFTDSQRFPEFSVSDYGKIYGKNKSNTMVQLMDDDKFAEKLSENGVVTEESLETTLKDVLGDEYDEDENDKDASKDGGMPEWAGDLVSKVDENAQRIETIAKQSGGSTQIKSADDGDDGDEMSREERIEQQKRAVFLPESARGD